MYIELINNSQIWIYLRSLKRDSTLLEECYKKCALFVSSTFSPLEQKQTILSKQNNPDLFVFLTHEKNWCNLADKIKQETKAEIKKKDDIIQAKG